MSVRNVVVLSIYKEIHLIKLSLPVHVTPLPRKPVLQAHENEPGLLVHLALTSQLCLLVVHSLISERTEQHNISCK